MLNRRRLLSLALSALLGLMASEARAEVISMLITGPGGAILVDTFITGGSTSQIYGSVDLAGLNTALAASGYAYQFAALGGSSNWPGTAAQGTLNVSGGVGIVPGVGGGFTSMTLTETEDGYTAPTGPAGVLLSSSTGNFTNQPAGGGHSASSAFNLFTTPTYSVLSTTTDPNPQGGIAGAAGGPLPTLYRLTNSITFGLTPSATVVVSDGFSVTATVVTIPEPASLVMFLTGMPVPIAVLGWLRRRRRAVA
jgi:hypothetical protein